MSDSKEKLAEVCLPVRKDNQLSYHIYLETSFSNLPERIKELKLSERKVCIVTDSNVNPLYGKELLELLTPCCQSVSIYEIPAGEANKNLGEIQKLYKHLILHKLDRQDCLLALGGGVTGDMTGFAAATYLRGIRFIQVPTTLLSQVDSSIGGKTGVDFDQYKNMVGAFHQPSLVYINIHTLTTLPEEQLACGMGEVLKHGLIKDASYYEWTINHMTEIEERDPAVLLYLIEGSCRIKRQVVEKDPLEKGERALLNFGHTIGHAIEKLKDFKLLHGQCVALGSVAAAYISRMRGLISDEEYYEIRDMNVGFGLPISFDGLKTQDIIAATKHDKKMASGKVKFILLKGIGHAFIDTSVTEEEMTEALKEINADLWS
ncbi:MAG: 3-dehydroquinate synthase [Lachnospiraceae bacterium]|nr:3-dehydroquinate synthase [Lachnospiraceae bacterium]